MATLKRHRLHFSGPLGPIKTKSIKASNHAIVMVDEIVFGKIYEIKHNTKLSYEYRGKPIGIDNYEWLVTQSKEELRQKLKDSLLSLLRQSKRNYGLTKCRTNGERKKIQSEADMLIPDYDNTKRSYYGNRESYYARKIIPILQKAQNSRYPDPPIKIKGHKPNGVNPAPPIKPQGSQTQDPPWLQKMPETQGSPENGAGLLNPLAPNPMAIQNAIAPKPLGLGR